MTIAGGATEQAIITVFGTEDGPKLVVDLSGPHTITEIANDKNDSTPDQTAPGTLHFSDVDLNDTHTVSSSVVSATWSGGGALPSGLSTTLASALSLTLHDSTHAVLGSVDFTFSAADKNFDFLAEGETLTVTYNVTVMDNFGATSTQPVTITITGSEDAPVITSSAQAGSATEMATTWLARTSIFIIRPAPSHSMTSISPTSRRNQSRIRRYRRCWHMAMR